MNWWRVFTELSMKDVVKLMDIFRYRWVQWIWNNKLKRVKKLMNNFKSFFVEGIWKNEGKMIIGWMNAYGGRNERCHEFKKVLRDWKICNEGYYLRRKLVDISLYILLTYAFINMCSSFISMLPWIGNVVLS